MSAVAFKQVVKLTVRGTEPHGYCRALTVDGGMWIPRPPAGRRASS